MRRVVSFQKLEDPNPLDIGIIAAQRAKLYQAGFPIAPGFVLTPNFFKEYIIESGQHEAFFTVARSAKSIKEIHDYITSLEFPNHVEDEILKACEALKGKTSVTVSGAFHDAVFELHGLQQNQVLDAIKSSWASIFHDSRKSWLNKKTFFPSVIIQKDMNPEKSGSLYTHNPVNKAGSRIVIDVNYPSKSTIAVRKEDGALVGMKEVSKTICLNDEEKDRLVKLAKSAESFYNAPQKISWVLGENLYITESRDITKEDANYFFNQATSSESRSKDSAN
ncbi:MAG: PEP/pyruvate-binding domain-containing protein [Candidatus Nanoarchaeia archaeon]